MSFITNALGISAGLGSVTLGYALVEAQSFTTRHVEARVLPQAEKSLRVLHLSDLHITPAQTRKINWVKSLASLEPDLVVVTGDFMAHKLAVPAIAEALEPLLDFPGLFVMGSNDYYGPQLKNPLNYLDRNRKPSISGIVLPTQDLVDLLTDAGWIDLNNRQESFEIADVRIHARGTNDAHINLDNYSRVAGAYEQGTFALGVTHAPYLRVLNQFADDKTDLLLAGHTHGGQICIPFYGALVTNCDLPANQAKGLSTFTGAHYSLPLHVSAGIGTSPFTPVRIACRPEATLLTLTSKSS